MIQPRIGEYWQRQGGIFVGTINHHQAEQQWHLIMAVEHNVLAYSEDYTDVDAEDYWDGKANTQKLLEAGNSPIAKWAAELSVDGHKDFYIPAQCENNLIRINAAHLCEPIFHWSSTQYSADTAWDQYFEDGYQLITSKGSKRAVRAVRRLPI